MAKPLLKFQEGYKFQVYETFSIQTGIIPEIVGGNDFVSIGYRGLLTINRGYAWDGASGPAIDTLNFRRGSLVHDALYQLIRLGNLTPDHQEEADDLLKALIIEDCMWSVRAWWVHKAVRTLGHIYLASDNNPILIAP